MPQPLQNGTVIGEKTVYPNFVTHVCDEGFILRGPARKSVRRMGPGAKAPAFVKVKSISKSHGKYRLERCIDVLQTVVKYFIGCRPSEY